ncbi:MAG: PP0621 family protein [Betaproteobacteria bacterium]
MKYLLMLALAVLALLWWRSLASRGTGDKRKPATPPPPPPPPPPQAMIACDHCGVHLPGADAVQGAHGAYCSPAHRQAAEKQ